MAKQVPTVEEKSAVIDMDKAMEQVGDDKDFLKELLVDFLAQRPAKELRALLAKPEYTKFCEVAHAQRGAALNLGCEAVADRLSRAEMWAKMVEKARDSKVTEAKGELYKVEFTRKVDDLKAELPGLVDMVDEEYDRLAKYVDAMGKD